MSSDIYNSSFIIAGVDKLSRFINGITWPQWIAIYIIIAIVSTIYLAGWRNKKMSDQALLLASSNNTKRRKAIEQFQNFNTQLATELNQQCEAELAMTDELPTTTERASLFINPNISPSYMVLLSPASKTDYDTGKLILDNFLFTTDGRITEFVNKTRDELSSIVNNTQRNNQYAQEVKLDAFLDNMPSSIKQLDTDLDAEFIKSLAEGQIGIFKTLTTTEKESKAVQFDIEVRERLFELFAADKRKLFRQICKGRAQQKEEQAKLDSGIQQANMTMDTKEMDTKEMDTIKATLADLDAQYKGYIFILSRFATTNKALDTLKRESGAMSTLLIQPANENQIDGLSLIKQKMAAQARVDQVNNPGLEQQAELDLAKKYSGAYQDYLDSLDKNSIAPKLDPVNIIGNLEERTLDFLTQVNSKLQGDMMTSSNKSVFQVDNRFKFQPNNLGSWMQKTNSSKELSGNLSISKTPVPANDIAKLDAFANINSKNYAGGLRTNLVRPAIKNNAKEGFQDVTASSSKETQEQLVSGLEGFFGYIYELITGFLDKETVTKLEGVILGESNMIPVGVILIGISIVLFLASSGDSSASKSC